MTMGRTHRSSPAEGTTTRSSYGIFGDLLEVEGAHPTEPGVALWVILKRDRPVQVLALGSQLEMILARYRFIDLPSIQQQSKLSLGTLMFQASSPREEAHRINTLGFGTQIRRRARYSVNWTPEAR